MDSTGNNERSLLALLPPLWVMVVIALSGFYLWNSLVGWYDYDLPASVRYFLYASIAECILFIVWGLWLLLLVAASAPAFGKHFVVWAGVFIAIEVAHQVFFLATPEFVFSLYATLMSLAQIGITALCIAIVRQEKMASSTVPVGMPLGAGRPPVGVMQTATAPRPSALAAIVAVILGLLFGGALGFGVGLGTGILIVELTDMSCFEGACGYAAFFLALGGLLIGAIAGPILGIWWLNRRRPAAA